MPSANQLQDRGPESEFLLQAPKSILKPFPFQLLPATSGFRITVGKAGGWLGGRKSTEPLILDSWRQQPQISTVGPSPSPCDNLSMTLSIRRFGATGIPQRPPILSSFSEGDCTCKDIERFSQEWNLISFSWNSVSLEIPQENQQ